jgi:peptidoglycan/xylan/chitin deacetylase (PgdA/CDA1 family)
LAGLLSSNLLLGSACQPVTEVAEADTAPEADFDRAVFELPPQSQLAPLFDDGDDAKMVVSLSFDDGFATQRAFFDILDEHHIDSIRGTFYLNSSRLNLEVNERDSRDHVRFGDLDMWLDAARQGHEIGSHTITHNDLSCSQARFDAGDCQEGHPVLTDEERRRQICGDREILLALGFDVTGFAYPFGRHQLVKGSQEIHDIVSGCGFSYARGVNGLARR